MVWYEPSPAGMRLGRAHLAGVTPCPSYCGTAHSLCAHDAWELALTHLVVHRGEARPSPVVCNGKTGFGTSKLQNSRTSQWNKSVGGEREIRSGKEAWTIGLRCLKPKLVSVDELTSNTLFVHLQHTHIMSDGSAVTFHNECIVCSLDFYFSGSQVYFICVCVCV